MASRTTLRPSTLRSRRSPPLEGILWFPGGSFKVTGPLTITKSLAVQGVSRYASRVLMTTATAGFLVNTPNAVAFSDLRIQSGPAFQTAGAGVRVGIPGVGGSTVMNNFSSFANVDFSGQYVAVDIRAGVGVSITNSQFADCSTGVRIDNPVDLWGDTGDHQIIGNVFASNRVPSGAPGDLEHYAIDHRSGGGIRIIGNKILGHSIGYRLALADTVSTADTMMVGNSMEGQLSRAIQLLKVGTTSGGYSQVTISNNQIAGTTVGIEAVPDANNQNWLYDVVITGNLFLDIDIPVGMLTGNNMMIGSNVFQAGGGTVIAGIVVAAAPVAQNVKIGPNSFSPTITTHHSLGAGSCTTCTTCN